MCAQVLLVVMSVNKPLIYARTPLLTVLALGSIPKRRSLLLICTVRQRQGGLLALDADLRAALEVFGVHERAFHQANHYFVTISVDGDQQLATGVSVDTLTPKWSFSPPLTLYVLRVSLAHQNSLVAR